MLHFGISGAVIQPVVFAGLELTPIGNLRGGSTRQRKKSWRTLIVHSVKPDSADGTHVLKVARTLNVSVMLHTGFGIPFANPINVEEFGDVRIVPVHPGANFLMPQALHVPKKKVMFSSDVLINMPVALAKYRALLTDEKELLQVFSRTVSEVFGLM
jgi:hypothetical protein